jgi:hypothetical protein
MADANPIKLCECGCGLPTKLAPYSVAKKGWVKGQPLRYLANHARTNRSHGLSDSREHKTWENMRERCGNPNNPRWSSYGGRGITVCDRWARSFENFIADMGMSPHGYTLERIDNQRGYNPDNCRWATYTDQAKNRRTTRFLACRGENRSVQDWARVGGITYQQLIRRLHRGWKPERAIFTPLRTGAAT